jgi:hypothetical protein
LESSTGSPVINTNTNASPNPLRISSDAHLALPVNELANTPAQVYFLSASMTLQYSANYMVSGAFGGSYIYVPASDLQLRLASGIYVVVARVNQREYRWKIAVIR